MLTNITLGCYSLHQTFRAIPHITRFRAFVIYILSLMSASSVGFICFVGYVGVLSTSLNILVSIMVAIVNAGISFNALNLLIDIKQSRKLASDGLTRKIVFKGLMCLGLLCGLVASITFYLASTDGLIHILNAHVSSIVIYFLALFIWFPYAALFMNAVKNSIVVLLASGEKTSVVTPSFMAWIVIIAIPSGNAYAQMTLEFFNSSKCIPSTFKAIADDFPYVLYIVTYLGFILSSLVNGFALRDLFTAIKMSHQKI